MYRESNQQLKVLNYPNVRANMLITVVSGLMYKVSKCISSNHKINKTLRCDVIKSTKARI